MRKKRYRVLGPQAQLIEAADGNDANMPSGSEFEAHPSNKSVERLLSMSPPLLLELPAEQEPEPIIVVLDEPEQPKPKPKAKTRKRRSSND